jgi:succinyl-CoA synthetase beta subunit
MIGYNIVTKQTTDTGIPVRSVIVNEQIEIDKEFYLAILLDRKTNGPAIVSCREGGMDIEEVAKRTPEAIHV